MLKILLTFLRAGQTIRVRLTKIANEWVGYVIHPDGDTDEVARSQVLLDAMAEVEAFIDAVFPVSLKRYPLCDRFAV